MLISPANAELIYVAADSVYTQNFDGLPNSGVGIAWTNNTTLAGWYSTSSTIDADNGSSSAVALYSFGTGSNLDRALGVVSPGATTDPQFGIAIRNNTGSTLKSFTIAYDGEQWRRSTSNFAAAQILQFGYRTSTTLGAIDSATYTNVSSLGFTSPVFSLPGGASDGNNSTNRTSNISGTIGDLDWKQGEFLWLRWQNENNLLSRHGLGIDNFTFSASTSSNITAVPEPSSVVLVSAVGWWVLRKRKQLKLRT